MHFKCVLALKLFSPKRSLKPLLSAYPERSVKNLNTFRFFSAACNLRQMGGKMFTTSCLVLTIIHQRFFKTIGLYYCLFIYAHKKYNFAKGKLISEDFFSSLLILKKTNICFFTNSTLASKKW